jgi:GAF domain-containing protein
MPDAEERLITTATAFASVARELASSRDFQGVLEHIVELAVEHVPHCEYAGISRIERRKISSPASSDEVPKVVDAIQAEVDEGPCLDAIREHEVFRTGDLAHETRWPRFSRRAYEETGVASVLSFRLFVEEDTMGSLNLYSKQLDAFDETDVALGSVFAAHAAVAMASSWREASLEQKSDARGAIGTALGIIMARSNVGETEAFDLLRSASQRTNVKLSILADEIVHSASKNPADEPQP